LSGLGRYFRRASTNLNGVGFAEADHALRRVVVNVPPVGWCQSPTTGCQPLTTGCQPLTTGR
jgi:hypothetical protein